MKKVFVVLAAAITVACLSSCTKTCTCEIPSLGGAQVEAKTTAKCSNVKTVIVGTETYNANCW